MPEAVVRAKALVGVRFRPQGRNAESGVDCVGVAILAFDLPRNFGRSDYRMRGGDKAELFALLNAKFRRVSRPQLRVGDLMILYPAPGQLHLAIRSKAGLIHADAGLRKVVERPGNAPWPLLAVFRRRVRG